MAIDGGAGIHVNERGGSDDADDNNVPEYSVVNVQSNGITVRAKISACASRLDASHSSLPRTRNAGGCRLTRANASNAVNSTSGRPWNSIDKRFAENSIVGIGICRRCW